MGSVVTDLWKRSLEFKVTQDRSHQWSTRPAHSPGRQWLSLDFEVLGRTDTLCENSDHYRPGLWSASWINNKMLLFLPHFNMFRAEYHMVTVLFQTGANCFGQFESISIVHYYAFELNTERWVAKYEMMIQEFHSRLKIENWINTRQE